MTGKKRSFWEKVALKQLSKSHVTQLDESRYLLDENELERLKKVKKTTLIKAGIAGALGIIVLYVPYHIFGETLFPVRDIWIPYLEEYVPMEIEFLVYSLVLVIIEIWYLTWLNVQVVKEISHIAGSPNPSDPQFEDNIDALIAVGLEKKEKKLKSVGINPYEGLSKYAVAVFQMLVKLRAATTGFLFKLLVKKLLGRYLLRVFVDLAGIPIYAFWNAWGSWRVMREARVRVLAPPLVRRFVDILYEEQKDNPEYQAVVFDTLQLISTSKRSFHFNHFLLAVTVMEKFGVDVETDDYDKKFLEKSKAFSEHTREGIARLLTFGILIDGRLSRRERNALKELGEQGVIGYGIDEVQGWSNEFYEGRGLENFFDSSSKS